MRKVSGAEQFALETGQVSIGKVANEGNWEGLDTYLCISG